MITRVLCREKLGGDAQGPFAAPRVVGIAALPMQALIGDRAKLVRPQA